MVSNLSSLIARSNRHTATVLRQPTILLYRSIKRRIVCYPIFTREICSSQPFPALAGTTALRSLSATTHQHVQQQHSHASLEQDKDQESPINKFQQPTPSSHQFPSNYDDDITSLEKAVQELEGLYELQKSDHEDLVKPLIDACKQQKRDRMRAADLVERILLNCLARLPDDLAQRRALQSQLVIPDIHDYNTALLICGSQRLPQGGDQAERIMRLLMSEHHADCQLVAVSQRLQAAAATQSSEQREELQPITPTADMYSFKFLSRAWALSGTYDGVVKGEETLYRLELLSSGAPATDNSEGDLVNSQQDRIAEPDVECYNTVLSAYARLGSQPLALERAKALFKRMKTAQRTPPPDWYSYHALLKCYRERILAGLGEESMVGELESLLLDLQQLRVPRSFVTQYQRESKFPLSWAFGILVDAYVLLPADDANEKEVAVRRAHSLLLAMAGDTLQVTVFPRLVGQHWPSHETIIRVYRAWTECESVDARDKDEHLDELSNIALGTRYHRIISCNRDLELWSQSGLDDAPFVMQEMLESLLMRGRSQGFLPTNDTFFIVMKAWLNSRHDEAATRNEWNLQQLMQRHPRVHCKFVVTALRSWLRHCASGEPVEGLNGSLLAAQHVSEYLTQTVLWDPWHVHIAQVALDAWAQQVVPPQEGALFCLQNATALLEELEGRKNRKRSLPKENYIAVLKTLSNVRNASPDAIKTVFQTATKLNARMRKLQKHTSMSFVLLTRAVKPCGTTVPVQKFLEELFLQARDVGMISPELIREIVPAFDEAAIQRFLLLSESDASNLVHLIQDGKDGAWTKHPALQYSNLPRGWFERNDLHAWAE